MTHDTAISTAGLTKHYPGVAALTDLSLDVPAGSIYGFLGPNGAGKSTTIKMLAGLIDGRRSGTASVAGIPVTPAPAYRREVGYLAQDPRFYDWMTGRETLRFVASLHPAGGPGGRGRGSARSSTRVGLGRRRGPQDRHLLGRHAPAPRASRQALIGSPDRAAPRRACQRPRPDRPPRGPRPHARAPGRGHGLLLAPTSSTTSSASATTSRSSMAAGSSGPPRPPSSSGASTSDQLRVVIGGADDATAVAIAVDPRRRLGRAGRARAGRCAPTSSGSRPGATTAVQPAITRFAADHGLTITENHVVRLGAGRRLPPPRQQQGACGMTASISSPAPGRRARPTADRLAGFGPLFRKELPSGARRPAMGHRASVTTPVHDPHRGQRGDQHLIIANVPDAQPRAGADLAGSRWPTSWPPSRRRSS